MDNDLKIIYGVWIFVVISPILILPLISAQTSLTTGLVSYWKMDEASGNIIDAHGSNDGVATGNMTYGVGGICNNAISFDGVDDFFTIADDITLNITGALSIQMWLLFDDMPLGNHIPLNKETWPANTGGYRGMVSPDLDTTHAVFRVSQDGSWNNVIGSTALESGSWYHIVGTYDQTTNNLTIYLNGSYDGSEIVGEILGKSAQPLYIGTHLADGGYDFKGDISNVAIWNVTLNYTQVQELWNDGNCLNYPFVAVDTCTCAGAGTNWEIDMSDYCNITTACDLTTGTLSFTGAGYCNCNASVKTTNLGDPGASGILYIQDSCTILVNG